MHWYYWIYYVLLLAIMAGGVAINLFLLPGLWLLAAAAGVYAMLTRFHYLGGWTLGILLLLALVAEFVELYFGGAAAKKAGGTKWGIVGAIIGGMLGGVFLTFVPIPVVSTIVGVCLGSFAGATVAEAITGQEVVKSLRVGLGAAQGRFTGLVSKLICGGIMWLIAAIIAFPVR